MIAVVCLAAASAAVSPAPIGYSVDCVGKSTCEMIGSSTPGGPAAVPNTIYCIGDSGLPGPYTMARGQSINGGCNGTRAVIYGDVYIVSSGSQLKSVEVRGQVVVMGTKCDQTHLEDVHAYSGVLFRPLKLRTSIDVSGSVITDVVAMSQHVARYPVAFAAATGENVDVTCATGTSVIVQPGQPTAPPVGLTFSNCDPAIDLNALFGIFGSAVERVVYDVGPTDDETASRKLLTSLVTIFGGATALQLLLLT